MKIAWNSDGHLADVEQEMHDRLFREDTILPELIWNQISAGGKRVRPTLAMRAVELLGGTISSKSIRAAASVEMVHVGSLIHDDIMDQATERRKVKTINHTHGTGMALVAGDLILGVAGDCAISVNAEVGRTIARALIDLSVGQQLETESLFAADRSVDDYYQSIRGKTGALLQVAASIAAVAEGYPDSAISLLQEYGMQFGLAFQILDDIFDIISSVDRFGKPVHNDFKCGVANLPVILALSDGKLEPYKASFAAKSVTQEESDSLAAILLHSDYIREAEAMARQHATNANNAIAHLDGASAKIVEFAEYPLNYIAEQLRRLDARADETPQY